MAYQFQKDMTELGDTVRQHADQIYIWIKSGDARGLITGVVVFILVCVAIGMTAGYIEDWKRRKRRKNSN